MATRNKKKKKKHGKNKKEVCVARQHQKEKSSPHGSPRPYRTPNKQTKQNKKTRRPQAQKQPRLTTARSSHHSRTRAPNNPPPIASPLNKLRLRSSTGSIVLSSAAPPARVPTPPRTPHHSTQHRGRVDGRTHGQTDTRAGPSGSSLCSPNLQLNQRTIVDGCWYVVLVLVGGSGWLGGEKRPKKKSKKKTKDEKMVSVCV